MRTYNRDEFNLEKEEIKRSILNGSVFIHPTDTIYGLGCNALDSDAVKRLRKIKKRYERPFSVIAPSKEWIYNVSGCNDKECKEWIEKLPGPYTLIIPLKENDVVAKETNNGLETLGVRIPDHWFSEIATELEIPIVTTSANFIGEEYMTSLEDLNSEIKSKVDFILYEGEKTGRPSKLVFLGKKETEIKER